MTKREAEAEHEATVSGIMQIIQQAVAAERERCAKVAEEFEPPNLDSSIAEGIAAKIREGT